MNKILDVFNTATDAYLEFRNNFGTKECFTEWFDFDEKEVNILFEVANEVRESDNSWRTIDYFFTKKVNEDYAEKEIHW